MGGRGGAGEREKEREIKAGRSRKKGEKQIKWGYHSLGSTAKHI